MSDKLTSIKGFGEGDPKPEKSSGAKTKALVKKTGGSFERMNKERSRQGYRPKTDRATKGLYDFFDK